MFRSKRWLSLVLFINCPLVMPPFNPIAACNWQRTFSVIQPNRRMSVVLMIWNCIGSYLSGSRVGMVIMKLAKR